ncbi:hypothetical protein [Desulfosporosinus hippei]|uniref:Uncharacterized protein n=1 Tax=Desulfosporosinus hippei DSM 8344 TaxID=1121419 RepID=A0A1G7UKZ2_9FIRM|nr:hypothetical protein [Desulfosporosinus hippei]SDG47891.1 hypothetical protein SAMN05443529_103169 [Desulfosporosinus hippei DSM 8344]
MAKPAFSCVGYEPMKVGLNPNCGNCKNWIGKCKVRKILDELYEISPQFNAFDRMMRDNRGVTIS